VSQIFKGVETLVSLIRVSAGHKKFNLFQSDNKAISSFCVLSSSWGIKSKQSLIDKVVEDSLKHERERNRESRSHLRLNPLSLSSPLPLVRVVSALFPISCRIIFMHFLCF
jgi:hypothetical protein